MPEGQWRDQDAQEVREEENREGGQQGLKTSLEGLHGKKEEKASWAQRTSGQHVYWTTKGSVGLELTWDGLMLMSGSRADLNREEQTESGA